MAEPDERVPHWGFLIFGLWYAGFGLAAFAAELNAPFFRVPVTSWDSTHRALLCFAGAYTLHVAVWALQMARMPRDQTRRFAVSLGLMLAVAMPAAVAFVQWRWSLFSIPGLAMFGVDVIFGAYFLASARRIPVRNLTD